MRNIQYYILSTPSLVQTTSQLFARGITLTIQDQKELQDTLFYICHKRDWIETNPSKLEDILSPFLNSPYLSILNYMEILKNAIIVYYEVRCRFHWNVEDSFILYAMYATYLYAGGVINVSYLEATINYIKKQNGDSL